MNAATVVPAPASVPGGCRSRAGLFPLLRSVRGGAAFFAGAPGVTLFTAAAL
jgi:hypothetical protein